jgi:hypothetical protein
MKIIQKRLLSASFSLDRISIELNIVEENSFKLKVTYSFRPTFNFLHKHFHPSNQKINFLKGVRDFYLKMLN